MVRLKRPLKIRGRDFSMNLHEYQAKKILQEYDVPVPEFAVATSPEEVKTAIEKMDLDQAVLKIQVHAGGRGKAGGVKFAKGKKEIEKVAADLIGMKMVNQQTGEEGIVAKAILISRPIDIAQEYYLSAVIDRQRGTPILIASFEGGMEIEEIAEKSPEKILKMPFGFDGKLRPFQLLRLVKFMGWKGEIEKQGFFLAKAIAQCFIQRDGSLLEINPLVSTPKGKLYALDAKISIDDNALFRQKDLQAMDDPSQVSAQEAEAKKRDLAYIAMDGTIGCMVNGAGLAMATMDIIELCGGKAANFLDVGGSATKEKVAEGFQIILADEKVKAILVNIFGGIMNCATLAEGIIHASKEQNIHLPIIVRMEGTNVEKGKELLAQSGLKIESCEDLNSAARCAVERAMG